MIILGISDSHEAHACLIINGKLKAAVAEERFSRLKSDMGYPTKAIEAVLETSKIKPRDIDFVAFAGQKGSILHRLVKPNALMKVKDWIKQCHEYWGPVLLENKPLTPMFDFEMFKELRGAEIYQDPYYLYVKNTEGVTLSNKSDLLKSARLYAIKEHLGVDKSKVKFYRHEDCHKAYGIFSSPKKLDSSVILTLEGGGDDSSATFSTFKNFEFKEHWKSNEVNIGRLYRYVTLILGMLPAQHEYKVMGLAPYGTEYHGKISKDFFMTLTKVNNTEIINTNRVKDLYFSIKDALEGQRFDGIAWGLQEYTEEILTQWAENCIKATDLKNLVISGGVGQNIKASKTLIDKTSLNYLWSGPICGDGSLGIGAAWLALSELTSEKNIHGIETIYLGKEYSSEYIRNTLHQNKINQKFILVDSPDTNKIAEWINSGKICARFSGKMEFGQRALGNRSILADPRKIESVERVNNKIKYRDFWMPFTPSMTYEESKKMIYNPKNIYSPYMTIAYDLNKEYQNSIPAAVHPSDKTVRPQMLKQEDNPNYYKLLEEFGKVSGIQCLMNTSFNLHGEAIVENPQQAIDTFERSELDILLFDDVAITRKKS